MKLINLTMAAVVLAMTASVAQADCTGGSDTHYIEVRPDGFFPTNTYVCNGDNVYFINKSGYWMYFYWETAQGNENEEDPDATNWWSGWISNGSTKGPIKVRGYTGDSLYSLHRWTGSSTVSASYGGQVIKGTAPTSY